MQLIADIVIGVVAALHLGFLVLEMFLWNTPTGHRIFGLKPELAAQSAALAKNQGLYNGFLAAGLIWGLVLGPAGLAIKVFFLACVVVAGIFGAATVNRRIFVIQALPAIVALALLLWGS